MNATHAATQPRTPLAWAARLGGAALLVALGAAVLAVGPALPPWVKALGAKLSLTGDDTIRWIAAAAIGAGLLTWWSGRLAGTLLSLAGAACAFAGIATLSGAFAATPAGAKAAAGPSPSTSIAIAAALLVLGLPLVWLLAPRAAGAPTSRRGASTAWHLLAGMAVLGATLAFAPRLPMRTTAPLFTVTDFPTASSGAGAHAATGSDAGADMITFEFERWEGRPIAEIGLDAWLPTLLPTIADVAPDGNVFLVFYNPRCSHCHELFREHFAGALDTPVIAIEIPPPPGGEVVETDEPTEIECPLCRRLTLPDTKAWGVTPPAVVRIDAGIVACASESNSFHPKDCIGSPAPAPQR